MSATMARQGGQVQLEQSDMCLALNMAKMAKEEISHYTIEETQWLINKPRTKVDEEKKQGVEFPGHIKVQAAMERGADMLPQNHMAGCLPCQHGTVKHPPTLWGCKSTGAPPPNHGRQPGPDLKPSLSGMPPAPTSHTSSAQLCQIENLPATYLYSDTTPPSAECFTLDAYAQDSQHNTYFDPDMLTDEGISNG